jgi:hypothetical protein
MQALFRTGVPEANFPLKNLDRPPQGMKRSFDPAQSKRQLPSYIGHSVGHTGWRVVGLRSSSEPHEIWRSLAAYRL